MSDLSAYLSISINLNFKTGEIEVTDNSEYPTGVSENITGIISTLQPDGIPVTGDWSNPDITWNGSSLNVGQVELRKRADQKPQQGTYVVTYQVDHPDYTPTTITKTFVLSYTRPEQEIEEQFDVFTPDLKVEDVTDYSAGNFDAPTISRVWSANIVSVGTVAGTSAILDLLYSGDYYDAKYIIGLTTDLVYQHSTYDYLTVTDRLTTSLTTYANTPPDYDTLKTYLKTIKQRLDDANSCNTSDLKEDYEYASALLAQIKSRLCDEDLVNIDDQIQDFVNVYNNHVTVAYVNTNTPIPTYDYTNVDCGTGGGPASTTDDRITNTMINHWNTAYNSIPPDDIELIVGVDVMIDGQNTLQLSELVNRRIRLIVNKIPLAQVSWQSNPYFSLASGTITLTGMTWTNGDLIQIQFY